MISTPVRNSLAAAAFVALAACGQTGPLYMPDKGGEIVTRPGATQSTPAPTTTTPATTPESTTVPPTKTPEGTTPKPEDEKNSQTPR